RAPPCCAAWPDPARKALRQWRLRHAHPGEPYAPGCARVRARLHIAQAWWWQCRSKGWLLPGRDPLPATSPSAGCAVMPCAPERKAGAPPPTQFHSYITAPIIVAGEQNRVGGGHMQLWRRAQEVAEVADGAGAEEDLLDAYSS